MLARRLVYAPLAMLLAISMPAYGQVHAQAGGKRQPGQGQQQPPRASHPRVQTQSKVQSQQRQSQPPRAQPARPQQTTPRQQTSQSQRRDGPTIKTYPGQNSYRPGSRPPVVQQRYDAQRSRDLYRHTYRATKRYRVRPYVRPRGWYLRDWTLGQILPSLFWTRSYWIVSYWLYNLPIPPIGCIWVRYDHDALLIDRHTGEVIQVIYDVFY